MKRLLWLAALAGWPAAGAAALIAGCGDAPVEPELPDAPLDDLWITRLVASPSAFTETVAADRDAWAALHRSDLVAAAKSDGVPGARARVALAELHEDLARIGARAWAESAAAWDKRSGVPEGSALPWYVGLSAAEAGDLERARAWMGRAASGAPPAFQIAARALLDAGLTEATPLPERLEGPPENAPIRRYNQHMVARSDGAARALRREAPRPVHRERAAGHDRQFFDPQIHYTLASARRAAAARLGAPAHLAALLFSACPTADDLAADAQRVAAGGPSGERCAAAVTWSDLGLDTDPGEQDDPEAARAQVRTLDRFLDSWSERLARDASDQGRELLQQLALVPVFRSRALLAFARRALGAGHPRQALAFAQLAMDLEHPRDLSPINAPGLFAVLADANLRTGHTREALDALQVLVDSFPEATGVDEVVGDLAILQNMDRRGDSKEN